MANKKDLTTEELRNAVEEAKKNFEMLNKQLNQAIKEEEDKKKAQLALEKDSRKKEVDDALNNCKELLNAYVRDYGIYSSDTYRDLSSILLGKPWQWWF